MVGHTGSEPHPTRVFVGRQDEVAQLLDALDEASMGRGGVVFVSGEAGIGKSATIDAFCETAEQRGAETRWGHCYEAVGSVAYRPWRQVVRGCVAARSPERLQAVLGTGGGLAAQLLNGHSALAREAARDPEESRRRFFSSVTSLLHNIGAEQPLVVVLEDLHWADPGTLLLLRHVASGLANARLLVVGSFREASLHAEHPLAVLLHELGAEPDGTAPLAGTSSHGAAQPGTPDDLVSAGPARSLRLSGLAARDVAALVAATAPQRATAALAHTLHSLSRGNPLFLVEALRLLESGPRALPADLADLLDQRLAALPSACQATLETAALIGQPCPVDVLERTLGTGRPEIERALRPAVGAGLVLPLRDGDDAELAFSHDLVRSRLVAQLPLAEVAEQHRHVAVALESLVAEDGEKHLGALAHHWEAAGERALAAEYAARAGEVAERSLAFEDAVDHYELAASLSSEPATAARLLMSASRLAFAVGDRDQGRVLGVRAVGAASDAGDDRLFAKAVIAVGGSGMWVTNLATDWGHADTELLDLGEQALARLGTSEPALRARLLARMSGEYEYSPTPGRRLDASSEALDLAREAGDTAALLETLHARALAVDGPDGLDEREQLATELLDVAAGLPAPMLRGASLLARCRLERGDRDGVVAVLDRVPFTEELQRPLWRWPHFLWEVCQALLDGRFADAEALVSGIPGQYPGNPMAFQAMTVLMYVLYAETGRLDQLLPALEALSTQYPEVAAWPAAVAWAHVEAGRLDSARVAFARALAISPLPRDQAWPATVATLAATCARTGDAASARPLYELLAPFAKRCVVFGSAMASWGSTERFLGMLATTLGDLPAAEAHFEAAIQVDARLGAPLLAHTRAEYAAALLTRGTTEDRARAEALLHDCFATTGDLGMPALRARAVEVAEGLRGNA